VTFDDRKYHHVAVVYDDGSVQFYVDGKQIGQRWLPGGMPVTLARDLLVGEDLEIGSDEQFLGRMDDILVLGRSLTPDQIDALARKGAAAFVNEEGELDLPR